MLIIFKKPSKTAKKANKQFIFSKIVKNIRKNNVSRETSISKQPINFDYDHQIYKKQYQ